MNKKAVFYYIPSSDDAKARQMCACRLAEKAYQQKLKVYIYAATQEEVTAIDTQLWTFRDISFIPHSINTFATGTQAPIELPPVIIGTTAPPDAAEYKKDVLINLTQAIPDCHNDFPHLIEIIDNDDTAKLEASKHKEYYATSGYIILNYELWINFNGDNLSSIIHP